MEGSCCPGAHCESFDRRRSFVLDGAEECVHIKRYFEVRWKLIEKEAAHLTQCTAHKFHSRVWIRHWHSTVAKESGVSNSSAKGPVF